MARFDEATLDVFQGLPCSCIDWAGFHHVCSSAPKILRNGAPKRCVFRNIHLKVVWKREKWFGEIEDWWKGLRVASRESFVHELCYMWLPFLVCRIEGCSATQRGMTAPLIACSYRKQKQSFAVRQAARARFVTPRRFFVLMLASPTRPYHPPQPCGGHPA